MFDGFRLEQIDVGPVRLRVRHGSTGPPVVLLHGHPRTHMTWHRVAPRLAGRHTAAASIDCGHHMSEEAPDALAAKLSTFLAPVGSGSRS